MRMTQIAALCAILAACGSGGVPAPEETGEIGAVANDQDAQAPAPQPAPVTPPAASPAPVAQAPQPAPAPAPVPTPVPAPTPTYTQSQWEVIGIIEAEVAKITTHALATDSQIPGWLDHFEPRRATMTPWAWRQEMRRIAIEDGRRFGWADAPTRDRFTDAGARINAMRCTVRQQSYIPPGTDETSIEEKTITVGNGRHPTGDHEIPPPGVTVTPLVSGVDMRYSTSMADAAGVYRHEWSEIAYFAWAGSMRFDVFGVVYALNSVGENTTHRTEKTCVPAA